MPHEKSRSSLLSDTLDRRRALTISPGVRNNRSQTNVSKNVSPLKIPRCSTDEDEETKMPKDRKKSNSKIHWTQLASNGTSTQSDSGSETSSDQVWIKWKDIQRRQIKIVLEDVLQTEIGQTLQGVSRQSKTESKRSARERWSDQTSKNVLKETKRTSVPLRSDCTEGKDTSPPTSESIPNTKQDQTSKNSKKIPQDEHTSSQTLTDLSEVSSNTCSPRKSDSTECVDISDHLSEQTKPSTLEVTETLILEGSPQADEVVSLKCEEFGHGSTSLLEEQCNVNEDECSEHPTSPIEEEDTNECTKDAEEDEKEKYKRKNGEAVQELDVLRGSVLRLSVGADGEVPHKRCRLLDEPVPNPTCSPKDSALCSHETQSCQSIPPETIVLSSEEEEEEEEEEIAKENNENIFLNTQPLEGIQTILAQERPASVYEQIAISECQSQITGLYTESSSMMELELLSLHIGGVSVTSNDKIKMTTEEINISLKDSSVSISLAMESVRKYSVWEGTQLRGCELFKDDEIQPPSLLLLWLSDAQAQRLHRDLSKIIPRICPAEGSTCVVLCLAEPIAGIESAMLASLMDLVALHQGCPDLLTPLTHSESLELLQSSDDVRLLQLLTPESDAQTSTAEDTTASASVSKAQDDDVQLKPVYTVCNRRTGNTYRVSMKPALGPEWKPYRHSGPTRRLIQFPPPPSKGALSVTTEDLECLDSGEFLNDVIIDFYLKYLLVQKAPRVSVNRSHVFSSFFYKQLTRRDNANEDSTSTPAQVRRHQRVKTWTRHVDIFEKDFLFVPVNQESHWYLVVICFPGLEDSQQVDWGGRGSDQAEGQDLCTSEIQSANQSNSDEDKDADDIHIKSSKSNSRLNCTENTCVRKSVCKRPCILVMDSLKLSVHERVFKLLREYLQMEWEAKKVGDRDFGDMVGSHCKVPLQDNSSDCGLYLLQYAESFLQDPVVHFDLPLQLEQWFPRQQVRGKREEIRDLILHMCRFQRDSLGNESLQMDT